MQNSEVAIVDIEVEPRYLHAIMANNFAYCRESRAIKRQIESRSSNA